MQVFKLYFKILKKSATTLMVYIGIFLLITILFAANMRESSNTLFEESKIDIALINQDKESSLLNGFQEYLSKSSNFVDIEETKEGMQDALFFREVSYIMIIPKGFTEEFLNGNEPVLVKHTVPDSTSAAYVDIAIDSYFNTAKTYVAHLNELSEEEMVEKVSNDLAVETQVGVYAKELKIKDNTFMVLYFNYLVYALLSVLMLGISSIMISLTKLDIKRRNLASPIPISSIQLQQILGNLSFTFLCDVLLIITGLLLSGRTIFDKTSLLFSINVIVFSVAALSIAYLVGILVKGREASNGIANVVSLGLCFVSGVFVPLEFLGETAIQIAKFTPAYWYTTANAQIGNLTNFSFSNLSGLFGNMLIQLGFAIAIFSIALVANKKKSTETA